MKLFFVLIIGVLALAGCGHPAADMMFNTSTEAYPVSTDNSTAGALDALGGADTGITVSSALRIEMQGIADSKMQSVWLQALVLQAKEGDLRFVQQAKCFVQPHDGSSAPVEIGTAKADHLSDDGRSIKFDVNTGVDLSGVLRNAFTIVVEIEGTAPTGKVSVSAELTMKAHVTM